MAKKGIDRLAGSLGQAIQRHGQRIQAQQQITNALSVDRANKEFQSVAASETKTADCS